VAGDHASPAGGWLVLTKKGGRATELDYAAARRERFLAHN
jgi:hypothetical protein